MLTRFILPLRELAQRRICQGLCTASLLLGLVGAAQAAPLVPGSGYKIAKVGDDFEDPKWQYLPMLPKSSSDIDKNVRGPGGYSANGRWYEGAMRGQPDHIRRVPTPDGGIPGSTGSMLFRTLRSGIPGNPDGQPHQDDLIINVQQRIGGFIPVSASPNCVVRVFLPPFDQWEQRYGNSFGFRASLQGSKPGSSKLEQYWPGMFLHSNRGMKNKPPAQLVVRGGPLGGDFFAVDVKEAGWWTLGMSFTPDGAVHYYAKQGVEDLTDADRISSQWPYGFHAERFENFFFNLVNQDDGHTWSTPWIIDDPTLYSLRPQLAEQPKTRSR